jgi:hypothetical protein
MVGFYIRKLASLATLYSFLPPIMNFGGLLTDAQQLLQRKTHSR